MENKNIVRAQGLTVSNILAIVAGNAFEWFDYVVYASLSYIIASVFFSSLPPGMALVIAMATFGISYITRPLGSLVLGRMCDSKGRKTTLCFSGIMLASASLMIALLPSYESIGLLAPLLLLLFRMVMSFAIGGEFPAMVTYLVERAPPHKKALYGSIAQITTTSGVILAGVVIWLIHLCFTEKQLMVWAWRMPFALSVVTLACSVYWRLKLSESPVFTGAIKQTNKDRSFHPGIMARIFFVVIAPAVCFYTYTILASINTRQMTNLDATGKNLLPVLSLLVFCCLIPLCGKLADRFAPKNIMATGMALNIFLALPLYTIIETGHLSTIIMAQIAWAIICAMILAPLPAWLAEMTPVHSRATSIGVPYSLCLVLFGGLTPSAELLMINKTGSAIAPGFYLAVTGVISLMALLWPVKNAIPTHALQQPVYTEGGAG